MATTRDQLLANLPKPGTLIDGVYEVGRPLGAGGMGGVVHAKDLSLARDVAIKLVHPNMLDDDGMRRFRGEARAMAAVSHENVVPIYDVGDHEGSPYIVMEYIDGPSLAYHLEAGPLSIDEAVAFISVIAQGVEAIHDAGIVHGDLKPANILIGPGYHLYVTDFGVTVDATDQTSSEGTPGYLAPERLEEAESVPYEKRFLADVYSLGVMAFELLAGRRPFEAPDAARVIMQQLYKDPPSLLSVRPDLSPRFDEIVQKAIARDAGKRTQTVREFRLALDDARSKIQRRRPRSLLVVDDDPAFLKLVGAILEEELPTVQLELVRTGEEALRLLKVREFHGIAVDLHLPGVNGLELAAIFAETGLPVLVLTGTGTARDWRVLSQLGVREFIFKPIDPGGLVLAIEQALYPSS